MTSATPWETGTALPLAQRENDFINELGMKMSTGAGTPGFPCRLGWKQQPLASLVPPCLSFPKQERLFIHRELGNRQVWEQEG